MSTRWWMMLPGVVTIATGTLAVATALLGLATVVHHVVPIDTSALGSPRPATLTAVDFERVRAELGSSAATLLPGQCINEVPAPAFEARCRFHGERIQVSSRHTVQTVERFVTVRLGNAALDCPWRQTAEDLGVRVRRADGAGVIALECARAAPDGTVGRVAVRVDNIESADEAVQLQIDEELRRAPGAMTAFYTALAIGSLALLGALFLLWLGRSRRPGLADLGRPWIEGTLDANGRVALDDGDTSELPDHLRDAVRPGTVIVTLDAASTGGSTPFRASASPSRITRARQGTIETLRRMVFPEVVLRCGCSAMLLVVAAAMYASLWQW